MLRNREVVTQAVFLLGSFRSHESIRRGVIKEGSLLVENQEKKLKQIENLNIQIKKLLLLPIRKQMPPISNNRIKVKKTRAYWK